MPVPPPDAGETLFVVRAVPSRAGALSFPMHALHIHAGPRAREHIRRHGLSPEDIRIVAGAAGGPKGLILGPLDEHIFGTWMAASTHPVHLIGASIGAWRMATGAMHDAARQFRRLAHDYIHERYEPEPGRRTPSAAQVSRRFSAALDAFFDGRIAEVIAHPRYTLHIVTSRGRHILSREGKVRTPLGYLGAVLCNSASRRGLGWWLERVVFSSPGSRLPLQLHDLPYRGVPLSEHNFKPALLASCSIPFVLQAVHDIPGAPPGAYWDGGITDYHLHWNYSSIAAEAEAQAECRGGLALYPHFQRSLVPGWLDKMWKGRHRPTPHLDNLIVLAPNPEWIRTLPNGKLPDRTDFKRYGFDFDGRIAAWSRAVEESRRLADEWAQWLEAGCPADRVQPL